MSSAGADRAVFAEVDSAYAVFMPYDAAVTPIMWSNYLKSLARPTGIEPVFPP